jgi:hypothetical protein
MRTVSFPFNLDPLFPGYAPAARWQAAPGEFRAGPMERNRLRKGIDVSPEEMMRISRRDFLIFGAVLLSACMYSQTPREPQPQTTVKVDNQAPMDMNIYVLRGGQRIRLGTAGGFRTTVLTIPSDLIFGATALRFLADPIGSSRMPVSDEITVSAGDQVTLLIPPQ